MPELIQIANCSDNKRVGDVIFVHGLDGNPRSTWQLDRTEWCDRVPPDSFWPKWIGEDLINVGIWSLGYDGAASGWWGRGMPLEDRATQLLKLLEVEGLGVRPIVFVAHSMGGLIVKQMLVHAAIAGAQNG